MIYAAVLLTISFFYGVFAQQTQKCKLTADVTFIIDKSGSIAPNGNINIANERINIVKKFISEIIDILPVGETNTRVVISEFNSYCHLLNYLNEKSSYTLTEIKSIISNVYYKNSDRHEGTYLGACLRTINEKIYDKRPSSRAKVRKILVVITDGDATDKSNNMPSVVGPWLRGMKPIPYNITAFRIGSDFNEQSFMDLTGDKSLIFDARKFDDMEEQVESFADKICTIDCQFTQWSPWGVCEPISCDGTGRKISNREKLKEPANGGEECYPLEKEEQCEPYSEWSPWSQCQVLQPCQETSSQFRKQIILTPPDQQCSNNEELDSRSRIETRSCEVKCKIIPCEIYSPWSEWGQCKIPQPCKEEWSTEDRKRDVQYTTPSLGERCEDSKNEPLTDTRPCMVQCTEVDCHIYSDWSDWGLCPFPVTLSRGKPS
jgi:hypothetical protein